MKKVNQIVDTQIFKSFGHFSRRSNTNQERLVEYRKIDTDQDAALSVALV